VDNHSTAACLASLSLGKYADILPFVSRGETRI
jgi:hypothetical protein